MLTSVGQLRIHQNYWLVTHVCPELGRYYRQGFNWWNRFSGVEAGDTKWGPHISVVRMEMPKYWKRWDDFHEIDIEFQYAPVYRTDGKHLWFDVQCDRMLDIREELGLIRYPKFNLHITLGVYYEKFQGDPTILTLPAVLEG